MAEQLNSPKINSFYVILSGFFNFSFAAIDQKKLFERYDNWQSRINNSNYTDTFNYLSGSYYDSYLNIMLPEVRKHGSIGNELDSSSLNHLTAKQELLSNFQSLKLNLSATESIDFKIDFIDLFMFPQESGLFSIKLQLNSAADMKMISAFLNKMRQLKTDIVNQDNSAQSIKKLIDDQILSSLNVSDKWDVYNPQLKSYIVVDIADNLNVNEMNCLLYDIGNDSPLGSAKGTGNFAPSEKYFHEQIHNNVLSVFNNWSCLSLFDTFSRVSINAPDKMKSWEYDYFNLYIHCLFVKYFLYNINTAISNVTKVSRSTERLRNQFVEFMNDYHHTHVSYKFLPNMVAEKLYNSLLINDEIDRLETKIQRINSYYAEKREQKMNFVLVTLTFLSIFSFIADLSGWLLDIGIDKNVMFPFLSPMILVLILITLLLFYKFGKRDS